MAGEVKLAIVGATGAVGQEMLKILEERHFQLKELICLADPREARLILLYLPSVMTLVNN